MTSEKREPQKESRDELLEMAERFMNAWQKMPTVYSDNVLNKFRRNWFTGISDIVNAMLEEGRVSGKAAEALRAERDDLMHEMNRVSAGVADPNTEIKKSGVMGLIPESLVDRGDALLEKMIILLKRKENK